MLGMVSPLSVIIRSVIGGLIAASLTCAVGMFMAGKKVVGFIFVGRIFTARSAVNCA